MAPESAPSSGAGVRLLIAAALCGACVWPAAFATESSIPRIYQCTLPDGRKLTSDKPIVECTSAGKPQRELNKDGSQKGVFEAPLTEDEKAERERLNRQREAERTAQELEVRRDRDMLKRYANEAAHGKARARALDDVATAVRSSEARIKLLLQERKPLEDEKEFYVGKSLPHKLKLALDANDAALEAQRALVQNQQTEIVRVNSIYDGELARLKKLWAGAQPGSLGPAPSGTAGGAAMAAGNAAATTAGAAATTAGAAATPAGTAGTAAATPAPTAVARRAASAPR